MKYLMAVIVSLMSACAPVPVLAEETVTVTVDLAWKNADWSFELLRMIRLNLSRFNQAKDIESFCPRYRELGPEAKAHALAHLFVAVAKYESNYNPKTVYREANGVDSIGLYQLSYGDRNCPRSKKDGDLQNPIVNIRCAVAIAADFVERDQLFAAGGYESLGARPPKGMARYWSVMREPDRKRRHHLADIQDATAKAPGCL